MVNLNARLYDPTLGRFTTADPTTQNAFDLQELNRFAYVDNNPLSLTDPTGYGGKGGFFKTALFRQIAGIAAAALLSEFLLPELIEPALGWTVTANSTGAAVQATVNAGISGGVSGAISTGTLKGAALGAGEALAFAGVHFAKIDLGFPDKVAAYSATQVVESAGMHAMVGGLFSVAGGGKFTSGFVAAGFGDLANSADLGDSDALNLAKSTIAGGAGSMLGGGKFANGAATGAFGYLFNDMLDGKRNDAGGGQVGCWISRHFTMHDNGDCALYGCDDVHTAGREDPLNLGGSLTYGDGVGVSASCSKSGGDCYAGFGFAMGASERPELDGGVGVFHFKAGDPTGPVARGEISGGSGLFGGGAEVYINHKGIEFEAGPSLGAGGLSGSVTGGYRMQSDRVPIAGGW